MDQQPLLEARITRAGYPNGFSIKGVSFKLWPGELLVVTGPSGSGKTTLLKSIMGTISLDKGFIEGTVRLNGRNINEYSFPQLYRLIGYIPQEPWYGIIGYTVETEYCLGMLQAGQKCRAELLGKHGLGELWGHITYGLSAGQYQRLVWATALDKKPTLLIVDEPLVYIDSVSRREYVGMMKEFIENHGSAIIVDHDPATWKELEPVLLALDNGTVKYYGEYNDDYIPRTVERQRRNKKSCGDIVLEAYKLVFRYPGGNLVIREASLRVRRGEIVGIMGRNGSGKTTLLKILAGIYKPLKGRVLTRGKPIIVPEEPLLYFTHPIPREELGMGKTGSGESTMIINAFRLRHILDRPVALLSSGERRRVAIASALLHGYDIILLDEPSGGLDPYSLSVLLDAVEEAAQRGAGIVIATHDDRLEPVLDSKYVLEGGVLKRVS